MYTRLSRFLFCVAFIFPLALSAQDQSGTVFDKSRKVLDNAQHYLDRAKTVLDTATNSDAYDKLVNGEEKKLPIQIPIKNTSDKYFIKLDSLVINPQYAYAVVMMKLDPKVFSASYKGDPLYFAGSDIRFTKSGGFTGDATMVLLSDCSIPMGNDVTLSLYSKNPINGSMTYATFGCDGFEELHVSGGLTFSQKLMMKEDNTGKTVPQDVTVYFETTIKDWDDWIIEINQIPTFQLTRLAGFSWSVTSFVLDKSITRNSMDFVVPTGYDMGYLNGMTEMWNGVFFKNITVKMPREFKKKSAKTTDRITISGTNFLIDQEGVTGELLATNLIPDGDIGRWTYTLDTVQVGFLKNVPAKAGFSGTLDMPLSKEKKADGKFGLAFQGSIDRDQSNNPVYHFNVNTLDSINFSMWSVAQVTISSARIGITSSSGNFKGDFCVSGDLAICPNFKKKDGSAPEDGKSATLLMVTVDSLSLHSYKSYWGGVHKIGLSGSALSLLSKLPIGIDNSDGKGIAVISQDDGNGGQNLGVQINLYVNFMKTNGSDPKSSNGFGGTAQITVWAAEDANSGKWKYDRTELGSICIAVKNGGFELDGCVTRYGGDPTYGEGFEGKLHAKFKPGIEVYVSAMFGRKSSKLPVTSVSDMASAYDESGATTVQTTTYRYWYVDASVKLPVTIPIFEGIGINMFMGGAYHHMTTQTPLGGKPLTCNPSELGCANTGTKFLPDSSIFLGVRAGVGIVSMPTAAVFSGNLLFGIEFLDGGGINKIYFDGLAKFVNFGSTINVGAIQKLAAATGNKGDAPGACEEGLSVGWHTEYNFPKETFSGTIEIKVNVAEVIKGVGDGCTAGLIEIYFSPQQWYLYIGRPTTPTGINLAGLLKIESYFVVGSVLPDPPMAPMPDGIAGTPLDASLLPNGGGIGLGVRASAGVSMGVDLDMGPCDVNAGVEAGFEMGFDVLIAKDRVGIDCGGQYNPRGINQWYATGQIYILAWGSVKAGYSCKLIGSGTVDLLDLRVAAYVFGQLPKPTYLKGGLDAEATLLGMFSASLHFDFKYGDQCNQDISSSQKAFDVVEMVFPSDTLALSSVYTSPSAILKQPIGSSFPMNVAYGGNSGTETVTIQNADYKVTAYSLATKQTSNVSGVVKLDNAKTTVSFVPYSVLPDSAIISVQLTVSYSNGGSDVRNWKFQTIPEPDKIDNSNIEYAYPLPQMQNMYRSTSSRGYVRLSTVPNKPLTLPTGYGFQVRYVKDGTTVYANAATVSKTVGVNQIEFVVPSDVLKDNQEYKFQIVKTSTLTQKDDRDYTSGADAGMAGGEQDKKDIVIIEYTFKTSLFSTFEEKMAAFSNGTLDYKDESQGVLLLGLNTSTKAGTDLTTEGFSNEELQGYTPKAGVQMPPMIALVSSPVGDYVHALPDNHIAPNTSFTSTDRLGPQAFPPYDAVRIAGADQGFQIRYEVIKYLRSGLLYDQTQTKKGSTTDRQNALVEANKDPNAGNIIMKQGVYQVTAKYTLPGKTSSSGQVSVPLTLTKDILFQ